jgi:hypothetical protein
MLKRLIFAPEKERTAAECYTRGPAETNRRARHRIWLTSAAAAVFRREIRRAMRARHPSGFFEDATIERL